MFGQVLDDPFGDVGPVEVVNLRQEDRAPFVFVFLSLPLESLRVHGDLLDGPHAGKLALHGSDGDAPPQPHRWRFFAARLRSNRLVRDRRKIRPRIHDQSASHTSEATRGEGQRADPW